MVVLPLNKRNTLAGFNGSSLFSATPLWYRQHYSLLFSSLPAR